MREAAIALVSGLAAWIFRVSVPGWSIALAPVVSGAAPLPAWRGGLRRGWAALVCGLLAAGAPMAHADFANGGFEIGVAGSPPPGWTVKTYLNPGVTLQSPQTRAGLNLAPGGTASTTLQGAGGDSKVGTNAMLPFAGGQSVNINGDTQNKNANSISQAITLQPSDFSATDGLLHVRMSYLPVLNDAGHQAQEQAYYFISLVNVTRGTTLYSQFRYSSQVGDVPWRIYNDTVANTRYAYTNWQQLDIAVPAGQAVAGDQIELEILVAACSLGGHAGHLYVDNVTTQAPTGPSMQVVVPNSVQAGRKLTYQYHLAAGSDSWVSNPVVTVATPMAPLAGGGYTAMAFNSLQAPPGFNCMAPPVGAYTDVTCSFAGGNWPPGSTADLQISWDVPSYAATAEPGNQVRPGEQKFSRNSQAVDIPVQGTTAVQPYADGADLSVQFDPAFPIAAPTAGEDFVYQLRVGNAGFEPDTAQLVLAAPPAPAQIGWTCAVPAGSSASCPASAGTGTSVSGLVLPSGSSATVRVQMHLPASAQGSLQYGASVSGAQTDPVSANNSVSQSQSINRSADLSVSITDGVADYLPGRTQTYTVVAANAGPGDASATVALSPPAAVAGATWTCSGAGGASCAASGSGAINDAAYLPAGGSVTYLFAASFAANAAGSVSLTATVTPDPGITDGNAANNSASDVDTQRVLVATTTALVPSPAALAYGQPLSLQASVQPPISGKISFAMDGSALAGCTGVAAQAAGTMCAVTQPSAGTHSFTAVFTPDDADHVAGSSAPSASVQVSKAAQSIAITSTAPSTPKVGRTYSVAASAGLSSKPLVLSAGGACSLAGSVVTFDAAGTCTVSANQDGDANYLPAAPATQTITVGQGTGAVVVGSSPNPSLPGQVVRFTVGIALDSTQSASLRAKAVALPTGMVEIFDGAASLGTAPLVNGTATIAATLATMGSHGIVAKYNGDANYPAAQSVIYAQAVVSSVATPVPVLRGWALLLLLSVMLVVFAARGARRTSEAAE